MPLCLNVILQETVRSAFLPFYGEQMEAREVKDSVQSHTGLLEVLFVRGRGASDLASSTGRTKERSQQGLQAPPDSPGSTPHSIPKEKAGRQASRKPLLSAFRLPVIEGSVFSALTSGEFRSLKQVG